MIADSHGPRTSPGTGSCRPPAAHPTHVCAHGFDNAKVFADTEQGDKDGQSQQGVHQGQDRVEAAVRLVMNASVVSTCRRVGSRSLLDHTLGRLGIHIHPGVDGNRHSGSKGRQIHDTACRRSWFRGRRWLAP